MNKYSLTNEKFPGHVILLYNDRGWLNEFAINAELTDDQRKYLYERLPLMESDIALKLTRNTKFVVTPIPLDLSFDAFWNKYNYKVSSRIEAERLWNKLSDGDRVKALNIIPMYDLHLQKKGYDKIYAERFLKKRLFDNTY